MQFIILSITSDSDSNLVVLQTALMSDNFLEGLTELSECFCLGFIKMKGNHTGNEKHGAESMKVPDVELLVILCGIMEVLISLCKDTCYHAKNIANQERSPEPWLLRYG